MDIDFVQYLQKHSVWPASPEDTFRETCGGKHGNIAIPLWNDEERKRFCLLFSQTTIWKNAIGNTDVTDRSAFELATGKRLDCLTQVYPKTKFKVAILINNQQDQDFLVKVLSKHGRFVLFKRSDAEYQVYYPDSIVDSEQLSQFVKAIEDELGLMGQKIDRRIYSGCIQVPGCFSSTTNREYFQLVTSNLEREITPDDILVWPIQSDTNYKNKKRKFDSNFKSKTVFDLIDCVIRDILVSSKYIECFGSVVSIDTLMELFPLLKCFKTEDLITRLCTDWEFQKVRHLKLIEGNHQRQWETVEMISFPDRDTALHRLREWEPEPKSLNTWTSNIGKRELGINNYAESIYSKVSSHFLNLDDLVLSLLTRFQFFVGCVAWLNDPTILIAMKGKSLGLVVTKDKFDSSLKQLYEETGKEYTIGSGIHPHTRFDDVYDKNESVGKVRIFGQKNENDQMLMHNKFLVFGDIENGVFVPKLVWTGSRNLTIAAKRHRENVVLIEDNEIASSFRNEWVNLYLNSEPLDSDVSEYSPVGYFVCSNQIKT